MACRTKGGGHFLGRHAQAAGCDESDGHHECDCDPTQRLRKLHTPRISTPARETRRRQQADHADNIANVAAYFASQPGAATGAKSALLPNVANTKVTFPEGYKDSFTKYHTINFPATKQVRYYYANSAAMAAAKAGKPLLDGSVQRWRSKRLPVADRLRECNEGACWFRLSGARP
jgi:hypothetical protein